MEWFVALSGCLIFCQIISATTNQQTCNVQMSYVSPYVEAFYSAPSPMVGCTVQADPSSSETHVINLKSSEADLLHTDSVVKLHIGPRTAHWNMRAKLVVLNSLYPVHWQVVTEHVGPLLFKFVIPSNSSVLKPTNIVVPTVTQAEMPSEDEALLEWVTTTYSKVWSFTSVASANDITLQVGEDPLAPEECVISRSNRPADTSASLIEPQQVGSCIFHPGRAQQEVHVVFLLLPRPNPPGGGRREGVVVRLRGAGRRAAASRSVVLVLQADTPVIWNVVSDVEIGDLTVVSSHEVNTDGMGLQRVSVTQESIPTNNDQLLSWAQDEYEGVVSFTEAVLANRFNVTVGKANISRQPYILSPDGSPADSINGPIPGYHGSQPVVVECHKQGIRALVPTDVAEHYNLSAEDVTLYDRDCTAVEEMTLGYMLVTQFDACGTTSEQRPNKIIYRNRVLFFNRSPAEGSGAGEMGSGVVPSDDDDEDSMEPFYTWSVECEFPRGGPSDNTDMADSHVTLHLDMYRTPLYSEKLEGGDFPVPLTDGMRLYLQAGVSGGQLRYDVVLDQCWVQVGEVIVHRFIDFACPVDQTVIFHEVNQQHVSLDHRMYGNIRRFSVEVLWTKETFGLHASISCKLSLCGKEYSAADEEKGIPVCSTLEALQQACLVKPGVRVGQQLTSSLSKTLEVGPLLDAAVDVAPADSNAADNEVGVGDAACLGGTSSQTISGLGAGPAAAIAFAAFTIGVLLTACLWFIHAHTGPRREIPGSPRTLSTPSSPMVNGHIPNGHLPNGGPPLARQRPPPAPVPNGPLHIPLMNGINPNQIPARGLMNGPIGESV